MLYNLCAHRTRGHFFCLYQFAKQLHWRGSLSDKYDPLIVLVCEAEQVTPSPRSSHHRIPVYVAPTQKEYVCVRTWLTVYSSELSWSNSQLHRRVSLQCCALYTDTQTNRHKHHTNTPTLTYKTRKRNTRRPEATSTSFPIPPPLLILSTPSIPLWPPQHSTHSHYSNLTHRGLIMPLQHLSDNRDTRP